jgi:hypothetical protein
MKRGQSTLLIFLVIVLIASIMLMISLIKTPEDIIEVPQESPTNVTVVFGCNIDSPFYCKLWSYSVDKKEILFQLQNSGNYDLTISEVKITNCDRIRQEIIILEKTSGKTVKFNCPIQNNQIFNENITINYKEVRGGSQKISSGSIKRLIE